MVGQVEPLQLVRSVNLKQLVACPILIMERIELLQPSFSEPSSTAPGCRGPFWKLKYIHGVSALKILQVHRVFRD